MRLSPSERSQRARLAGYSRHGMTGERVTEAQRDFRASRLEAYIREVVNGAPPLTGEQRDRLAGLLRSGSAA